MHYTILLPPLAVSKKRQLGGNFFCEAEKIVPQRSSFFLRSRNSCFDCPSHQRRAKKNSCLNETLPLGQQTMCRVKISLYAKTPNDLPPPLRGGGQSCAAPCRFKETATGRQTTGNLWTICRKPNVWPSGPRGCCEAEKGTRLCPFFAQLPFL